MAEHGLSPQQLLMIREILAPYASHIEKVGLFGSRATGAARPESDIDMVLYGPVDQALLDRLWTLFDESNLSFKVDLCAYPDLVVFRWYKNGSQPSPIQVLSYRDGEYGPSGECQENDLKNMKVFF